MAQQLLEFLYLLAAISFVLGLKYMNSPDAARKGNILAAVGMTLAVFGTIFLYQNEEGMRLGHKGLIMAALAIGTVIGTLMAKRVKMTSMPQMVSFFNGMGGACAALISILEFNEMQAHAASHAQELISGDYSSAHITKLLIIFAGLIIGSVSFSGSIIAYGKLEDKIKDFVLPMQQIVNLLVFGSALVLSGLMISGSLQGSIWMYSVLGLALIYGILFVLPIGGADMPVVISLLNSFTGVAAACGGFLYDNKVMLMGGVLVGSAGTILTVVMCRAMNRSLTNVLIGNFGGNKGGGPAKSGSGGSIREVSATDTAIMMKYAQKVIIVPGYGLAVAQAQHVCHELEELLEKEGVDVKYAIHPVAGRMPGHMNVLLAESNVSYDKLVEMEHINPEFNTCDVVLIVGANDVVNPAAKTDPSSPIYGMPILEVEQARQIVVMKRSMKAGYAGIDNELFYNPKCGMLFGDAKATLTKLVNEVKAL
ncbi:MAG: NAD(P)(+) transhydrogenase (Re/Si-specific) subunit beta [Bacteroidetes bacterium]|nr:NAD(P)(+) transhydrogenase (Re/Si-specific) subunit beta [Bacteroidota bacterium]